MMSRSNSPFDQIGFDAAIAKAVTTIKVALSIVATKQIRMPMRVAVKIMLKIFLHALMDFSFLSSLFFFSFLSSLMDFLTSVGSLRDLFHQRIVNCLDSSNVLKYLLLPSFSALASSSYLVMHYRATWMTESSLKAL